MPIPGIGQRDIEILIGAQADLRAYEEIDEALKYLGISASELDADLEEANNRDLRRINKRVQAYKKIVDAHEKGEASAKELREEYDRLGNSLDALHAKGDAVRSGRAEEDLRAFERTEQRKQRLEERRLEDNLNIALRERQEHSDRLNRIDKEGERQLHQINSTAERAKVVAQGDKQLMDDAERRRAEELQTLNAKLDEEKKITKELLRRARIKTTQRSSQLERINETAALKAQQKVAQQRERELRNVRRTEEDIANMRLKNERSIASIRDRAAAQDRRRSQGGGLGTGSGTIFNRVRNIATGTVAGAIGFEIISHLRTTVTELVNAQQEVANLQRAFVNLNKGSLLKSNQLLARLDRALLFSTKRIDLFRIGNLALNSGVESLGEKLPNLVSNIRSVSLALGRDMVEDVERVVKAMAKMETELLDELGIATRATQAHEEYARALGRTAQSLTAVERLEAFSIKTAQELQDKADRLTSVLHLQQQAVGELKATWEQTTLAIGKFASGVFLGILDDLRGVANSIRLSLSDASEIAQFAGLPEFATRAQQLESSNFLRLTRLQAEKRTGMFAPPTPSDYGIRGPHGEGGLHGGGIDSSTKLFQLATRTYDALYNLIGEDIGNVEQQDVTREFLDDLWRTLQIATDNIAASIENPTEEQFKVVSEIADKFADKLKGLENVRITNQAEINQQRKEDTESRLRALETEFKTRRAELSEDVSTSLTQIRHDAVVGELESNLARHIATLVSNQAELAEIHKLIIDDTGTVADTFKELDSPQVINRRNELNAAEEKLATTSRTLIQEWLSLDKVVDNASTIQGFQQTLEFIDEANLVMSDMREQAVKLGIPLKQVNKVLENIRSTATREFREAQQERFDDTTRPTNQISLLLRDANTLVQQGDKDKAVPLFEQAIGLQLSYMQRVDEMIIQLRNQADDAGITTAANIWNDLLNDPERQAEAALQLDSVIDAMRVLHDIEKKGQDNDDSNTEKISREIRGSVKEATKVFQQVLGLIGSENNAIVTVLQTLANSSLVRDGLSRIASGQSFLGRDAAGALTVASQLSLISAGISVVSGLIKLSSDRAEERAKRLEALERERLARDSELKNELKGLFSGFSQYDDVLQSAFRPIIEALEDSLRGVDSPRSLILKVSEILENAPTITLDDIVEVNDFGDIASFLGLKSIPVDLFNAIGELERYFPLETSFSALIVEAFKLSDAFQHLISSTSSVTEAQKQEIRDRFSVQREALLHSAQRNFSSDPYERAQQLQGLRSQLEALRNSESAAIAALQGGEGFNFPADFDSILTKFAATIEDSDLRAKVTVDEAAVVELKINDTLNREQVVAAQKWLDDLFALLNIDDSTLKDEVVAYLARLPAELSSNPGAQQVLEIADILGINEHTLYTTGLFTDVLNFLKTLPDEVFTYLSAVRTLSIDKLIGIADVNNTLRTHFMALLSDTLTAGAAEAISGTEIPLTISDILNVLPGNVFSQIVHRLEKAILHGVQTFTISRTIQPHIIDLANLTSITPSAIQPRTERLLDNTILKAYNQYRTFRGEQQYGINLSNITSIIPSVIQPRTERLLDNTILEAYNRYRAFRGEQQYSVNLANLTNITADTIPEHTGQLLDNTILEAYNRYRTFRGEQRYSVILANLTNITTGDIQPRTGQLLDNTILEAYNQYKAFRGEQQYSVNLSNLTSITPSIIQPRTEQLLENTILEAYNQYKTFRGEQQYGINLYNLTSITADNIPERTEQLLDNTIKAGIDNHHMLRTSFRYTINLDSIVSIHTGRIGERVRSAIDSAVSSAITAERASIRSQYEDEISAPAGPFISLGGL